MTKFFIALLFLFSANIFAQNKNNTNKTATKEVNIGFVNIRKLMIEAPQLKEIKQVLTKEFEKRNLDLIATRELLTNLNSQYNATKDKAKQKELEKKIEKNQKLLLQAQNSIKDDYNLRRNEELNKLQALIIKSVAAVSKEKSLDIVLNNTGIIYVNSRINITNLVLDKLLKLAKKSAEKSAETNVTK